ncbi:thioredoxin [Sodalis sp. CWE]|uniref:thioredoxin n=1 Tax=Sodalis sp. CWE TaxID=2803816 RepID=UPI001C7CB640|nr:thioredoxin [Sodalis sp. CWE]MBX4181116.1 thioredoxin [Sodalis sp. CWE]
MNDKVLHSDDKNFEKNILHGRGFFLVDFWAQWCGPCKMLTPILTKIADEFEEKVTFFKVNVDENPIITSKYNIRSIPTLLLFQDGVLVDTKTGSLTKKQLEDFLNKNLK